MSTDPEATTDSLEAGARRLRIRMVAALAALALGACWAGWSWLRLEDERRADTVLLEQAAAQRSQAEQAGRLGLWMAADQAARADHARALQALVAQAQADATPSRAQRLGHAAARQPATAAAGVDRAFWEQTRERLWSRADLLLQTSLDSPEADLLPAALALQSDVQVAAAAALRLSAGLRGEGAARRAALQRDAQLGLVALLLLALLAAVVVEAALRSLHRQGLRLRGQASSMRRLALVAENTSALVLITDGDDRLQWVNAAFTQVTGWTLADALGRRPGELLAHPQADEDVLRAVQAAVRDTQGLQQEWLHRSRSGADLWLSVDLCPLHADDGTPAGFVRVSTHATARAHQPTCRQALLQGRSSPDTDVGTQPDHHAPGARTDALTTLPTRVVALDRLRHALDHLRRHPGYGFAVLSMDFDRFRPVDETLGPGAGDELLRQIAHRLTLAVRPGDVLARLDAPESVAARLGGDEFAVVLDGISDEGSAQAVVQRMLQALSEPYLLDGCIPLQCPASIGVVLCTAELLSDAGPTAEELLRNADTALHEARRAGRGRWALFNHSMHERLVRALEVEADLRRALKDDELFVVYQPVVDLSDHALVGVEALVRWRHPQRGLVSPVAFIGIAEECGLIDAIGGLVLHTACSHFMQWQTRLGPAAPRQLAVNLSRAQLERDGLVDEVREVLQACAMPPEQLQLEITESLAAQGEHVQANLHRLKSLGVRLALDDFGTGYSSLSCLHQLPVDTVKVDRSFVQHAETVEYHRVLIEATIRVARTLGMTTVAEGIETPGQAELMRTLACDRGQGYLFSRPLEGADLERWVLGQSARQSTPMLVEPA